MGLVTRQSYFSKRRKVKMILFIPYSLTIIFPFIDSVILSIKEKDYVMLWHTPATFILGLIIIMEGIKSFFFRHSHVGRYE